MISVSVVLLVVSSTSNYWERGTLDSALRGRLLEGNRSDVECE